MRSTVKRALHQVRLGDDGFFQQADSSVWQAQPAGESARETPDTKDNRVVVPPLCGAETHR